jgi:hypothetical protein
MKKEMLQNTIRHAARPVWHQWLVVLVTAPPDSFTGRKLEAVAASGGAAFEAMPNKVRRQLGRLSRARPSASFTFDTLLSRAKVKKVANASN